MDSPLKVMHQLRRRVQSAAYGSAVYRMMLDQGPVPDRLRLSILDPWPGDARRGQELIASQPGLFERGEPAAADPWFLAHEALRDLRAVGTDLARRKAVALINDWLDEQESWDEESWRPDILGLRLANWIAFYDFYAPVAGTVFAQRQLASMARQLRHLIHSASAQESGLAGLYVIKGLLYGGLGLLEADKALPLAFEKLKRQLAQEILPDGGSVFRNPSRHAEILRALIDIRAVLRAGQLEIPHELQLAIVRMVPALKFFRHGDGGLALFHGGGAGNALLIDATFTLAEARGRLIKSLPHMGYERVTAGRSLLLVNAAAPPPRPFDRQAHAGLADFEFSVGRERLIVNCGAAQEEDSAWRDALRSTAAHSTLQIDDTNACELLNEDGIGHRPKNISCERYEQEGVEYIETGHDGYASRYKTSFRRLLGLAKDGESLMGREVLSGPAGQPFTLRWHLHPSVAALLAQGEGAALLRTPSGIGWRLRVKNPGACDLALETSIYCASGTPRRTLQLRLSGLTQAKETVIVWTLTRETIKKGG